MATAEVGGISPEQQQAYQRIAGFFGGVEKQWPQAAGKLVDVVGGLVGDQQTTRRELQAGMGNIDIGLALIGDWLKETGAEGFEVRLGLGGGAKKAIGRSQVKFPNVSDLIRVGGRVNPELQAQIPPLLSSFSRQIRGGLDVGLSPREIVGGLVAESVGSKLSADGSANLRSALEKPLAGHFEWIREALKIPDVVGQPGFQPMVAEPKPATAPKPLPEEAKAGGEKTGLPAFLEGGRIPEGYDSKTLDPGKAEYIRFRQERGNEMVIYVGNVGVYFKQPERGKASFVFLGFNFPENVEPSQNSPDNVRLTGIGSDGIQLEEGRLAVELCRGTTDDPKPEPVVRATGLLRKVALDLPSLYLNADGRQRYRDLDIPIFDLNIKVEGTWIVVTNNSSASKVRISSPRTDAAAREKTPPEVELSINERAFMQELEALVKDELREDPISAEALRQNFTAMQGVFSWLPDAGTFRTEIMKEVFRQLGPEAEQLKESGKSERQIYDEWLKKVFAPLFRRGGKQK